MNRLYFYFTLVCLLLVHTAWARMDRELLKAYKVAKKYYAASDYTAAKAALAPLVKVEKKDDLTPYALFYYALSAYYNKELALAEDTFTTIVEEYTDWEQQDEVWYWLGQLSFEAKDYSKGLDRLAKIKGKTSTVLLGKMKAYFLQQIDDIATLQKLLQQYPQDQDIASVLFDKAANQPLVSRDRDLCNTLASDFNIRLEQHDPLKDTVSLKKDSYNVGVFFPFFVDEVDYEEESSNSFVIALYQGIKVAVAELANRGININLFAYDTKKDPVTTAALLEQEEIKSMDLIIGPLYAATIPLVADFAQTYQINLFNPLSENTDVVGDNPFVFLFKSSLATQARRAAEFTLQDSNKELNVGIVYGTSKADIAQAHTYKQYIEHSTEKEVALMLSVAPEEAQGFLNTLKEASEVVGEVQKEATKELVNLEDLTHIYVASKDELIVANMLSAIATLKHPPHIIGHAAWLHHSSFTFDQLQQHRLSLVAPDYIDYEKAGIHHFRSDFYDHFAQYPTTYACTGYEMMLFLGDMLAQYGVYFQKHWTQAPYKGVIFEGVAYDIHHDNQHVPIVQYTKDRLVICN
jgi:hypothetical protein